MAGMYTVTWKLTNSTKLFWRVFHDSTHAAASEWRDLLIARSKGRVRMSYVERVG